jgi:hypothetical protein
MKHYLWSFLLLLLCFAPSRADNWLQNGDFSDGITHWHGDGRSPADFASDNPLEASDPFTAKGLIVPIKHLDWTKVAQDFKGKIATGVLRITFKVSPDLTFSDKPEDYLNMPNHIDYNNWRPFNTPPGQWVVLISDFSTDFVYYYPIKTKVGSSDVQTLEAPVRGLTPLGDKTMTLAFPPGTGTIVILSVALTDN